MVEWASGGYERTFEQSAANGMKEPTLPFFCSAAKVRFREKRLNCSKTRPLLKCLSVDNSWVVARWHSCRS